MYLKIIVALLSILVFVSCSIDPVTGKRTFNLVSEEQEINMGRTYDPQISEMYGVYSDEALQKYVNALGQKLAAVSHRPNLKYEIKVMDSPVVNAFAVPGGYVYITRGIMAYLNNEAALAGVVGHEIGHVAARHSAEQMSKSQLVQIGLGIGAALSETIGQYAGVAQQGLGLLFLSFGRDDEREADQLGVEYATKLGYDTHEMAKFFKVLDQMGKDSGQSLPDFLSTHPNPGERVGSVNKLTATWEKKDGKKKYRVNSDAYYNHINGIIYGPDPRQGFVEKDIFYHPQLRFQFPVPKGWTVSNLPSQVQISSEKKDALLVFKLDENKTEATAADAFITNNKLLDVKKVTGRWHGLQSVRLDAMMNTKQGTLKVAASFIKYGKNIFSFLGYTSEAQFSTYKPVFTNSIGGFKKLTNREKINHKPQRIRMVKIKQAQTLRQVLVTRKIDQKLYHQHQLLNDLVDLDKPLSVGSWVKVISE